VLACDDSATMRAVLRSLLEPAHEVLLTETAEEALRRGPGFRPDVILSDVILPGLSGRDLCRVARTVPGLAGVPFVLVTSLADADARADGLEAGADDYLTKPIRERELLARVASLVRLRRTVAALEERTRELERTNAALRDAQAALVRAEKLATVGTLAAGLAHEINNPLAVIKSGGGALARCLRELEAHAVARTGRCAEACEVAQHLADALGEAVEVAGEMAAGSRRLERITADLRLFATPSTAVEELVDPRDAIDAAWTVARSRFAALPRLELDVAAGAPIRASAPLVSQALLAVLENAVEAAGPGGVVRVGVSQFAGGIEVSVQDSGPGIAPDLLDRVFDPFFSTRPTGRGLGLAVAYGIVRGLGGEISAESPSGEGARIRVRLPRGPSPSLTPPPLATAASPGPACATPTA
jgi:signal transduction histidine kinase